MSNISPMQWNISFCNRNLHIIHCYIIYNICIIITAMYTYEVRNCKALLGKNLNWWHKLCRKCDSSYIWGKIIIRRRKRDTALFVRNNIYRIFKIKGATCIPTLNRALNNAQTFYIINTKTVTMYQTYVTH